jgi:hypothetical protein
MKVKNSQFPKVAKKAARNKKILLVQTRIDGHFDIVKETDYKEPKKAAPKTETKTDKN